MTLRQLNTIPATAPVTTQRSRTTMLIVALMTMMAVPSVMLHTASASSHSAIPATAQSDSDTDESEVTSAQIEKYVAVYKAMQHDRSLTVDAAAAEKGMTLAAFRQLEGLVQRDEGALQQVRRKLQASASEPAPSGSPSRDRTN